MFDYHSRKVGILPVSSSQLDALDCNVEQSSSSKVVTETSTMISQQVSTIKQRRFPFFIGVAGGTASGKTTVCNQIIQRLRDQCVVVLNEDSFYRGLTDDEHENAAEYNFDHPEALDKDCIIKCLRALQRMESVDVPVYDFTLHKRSAETVRVDPADVVIFEGILALHMQEIRESLNMKIFVDTDDDMRLARRIQRDMEHRGRDLEGVLRQYTRFVKPMFDQYVAPSRRHADVIIPWTKTDNVVAIDLITEHIRTKLQQHDLIRIYQNLQVVPSNYQIRGMHTIIRNQDTNKNDFIFYADRLIRLVVEAGLGHLPFEIDNVVTPTGQTYVGVQFAKGLCGVSIIRSGEAMENALRDCCKGISIGKILVMRTNEGGEPKEELIYEKLPQDIAEKFVLLLDPILGTGHTACRALKVLIDRGVQERKILFLSLIAAPDGIHQICTRYPNVQVITSEIDEGIDDDFRVVPGIGEFGDRYFCE
eukprot:TRINITY_DN3659_c0_g1_i2.p1 TRINITY_DN3659_c0_g1~~TRINITY_DN3659_c0_g1_i2.p1  ORF type:complete len:478 (-),score=58.15 TRINITY_DN3659_c0_g1_i2:432-1865(-)